MTQQMTPMKAVQERHSVRKYTDEKIEGDVLAQLQQAIEECNRESGLRIQLCLNEEKAFSGAMARYGKFENVKNYIALVGKKGSGLEEKCGYYGEKVAIEAQRLGLNTCWVAVSYSKGKSAVKINAGEKLLMVIAVGYGENSGVAHTSKLLEDLCKVSMAMPEWFRDGMRAVQLAPTAMNQQKFRFTLIDNTVKVSPGTGFYTKTDLGIAKYHFELGAGERDWKWA